MSKRFREQQPEQMWMLPPSLDDWLPEGHLARFSSAVVTEMDRSAIYRWYEEKDGRGQAAYHPLMMVKLLLYGYCIGVVSSRRIAAATYDPVALRYLAAHEHPDHDSMAEFRRRHLPAMMALLLEMLPLCRKAGLVKRGPGALDGTKIKAHASRDRHGSYAGLLQREKELAEQVQQILAEAERADQAEDERLGRGRRGEELPPELADRQKRLPTIRPAKAELERPAREEAERQAADAPQQMQPAKPEPEQKVNLSDGDSRIMRERGGAFMQGFHAPAAVDGQAQVLVAADVTQRHNDRAQLAPLLEQVEHNSGAKPAIVSADTDDYSPQQVQAPVLEGIDLYVRPDDPPKINARQPAKRTGPQQHQPSRSGYGPDAMARIDHLRAKLATLEGQAVYAKRREIVEPVFGQIQQWRGFRQFLLRGLTKTRAAWRRICLTHNLLQLQRFRWSLPPA
ncbi:MAG TPA: transposase [Candidatus Glassbacteria bacterium]|nr:transposase [Candidatus Glassbacteria bacterium]